MRFSCQSCQATFQTATAASAPKELSCPACGAPMVASAKVVELHSDRAQTRRYDLDELHARVEAERDLSLQKRDQEQRASRSAAHWFAGVQGRQVGPLSLAGLAGLRARGQLMAESLVWREGLPGWVALETVAELRSVVGLSAPTGAFVPAEDESLASFPPMALPPPLTGSGREPETPVLPVPEPQRVESTPFETSSALLTAPPPLDFAETARQITRDAEREARDGSAAGPPALALVPSEAAPWSAPTASTVARPPLPSGGDEVPSHAPRAPAADVVAQADPSPTPVLELSTPPPIRKSRGPMQQTWFADEEPSKELPGRKAVLGIAILLAVVALVLLLLRGGGGG